VHQLQLTIADLVVEAHDTHHPISSQLYFEDQVLAAKKAAEQFWRHRVPKFLGYFETVLERSGGPWLLGRRFSYVDLSLFQIVAGLRYAFPKRMKRFEKTVPRLIALHDRVAARPRIKAYLASKRRISFNEWGIFRHYKQLDA
jgi:glutathione S-transferase